MPGLVQVTDETFEAEVLKSSLPALVDFWADWCSPCRAIAPVVKAIAEEYGEKVKVCKLNVDKNPSTASRYGVMSIPTLILFKEGEELGRIVGVVPKEEIKQKLEKAIP